MITFYGLKEEENQQQGNFHFHAWHESKSNRTLVYRYTVNDRLKLDQIIFWEGRFQQVKQRKVYMTDDWSESLNLVE